MRQINGKLIRLQHAAIALATSLMPATVSAGTVSVEEAAGRFSIETEDAVADEILAEISRSQGFQIVRMGAPPEEKLSGQLAGPLGEIVTRILQNENYMIIHSPKAKGGIARIVIFGPVAKIEAVQAVAASVYTAPNRRSNAGSPQPLPREVLSPNAPAAPQQPLAKRPRS